MFISIVHVKRSGLSVPKDQFFDLSRSSEKYSLLGNDFTHLPLHKTKAKVQVKTVKEAIEEYDNLLMIRLIKENKNDVTFTPYRDLLRSLYNRYKELRLDSKIMYLGCWCKDELDPKYYDHSCHCDVIKDLFIKKWNKEYDCNS